MEFFEVNPTTGSLMDKLNSEIAGTIQTLEVNQNTMKQNQEHIEDHVKAIKDYTDSEFPTLREDLNKLIRKQIDSNTITGIHEKTENIHNALAELDKKLNAYKTVQDQCAEQLSESGMLFGKLNDLAEKEKTDAAELKKNLDALAADIARMEEKMDTAKQNSETIRTDIEELRSSFTGQLDSISQTLQESARAAADNQRMLQMISAYLSLPGYKSFFKGMGRVENEQIEG